MTEQPTPRGAFHVVNRMVGFLFLISALLQINDPDPWLWASLWTAAGLACFLRRRLPPLSWVVLVAALVWALVLAPSALPHFTLRDLVRSMQAETPSVELTRELLGLLLIAGWMAVLVVRGRRAARG